MPILQSHGNLVSRGDLITQDNISVPNVFTITINKDNFSQLCTVGNPGSLINYGQYIYEFDSSSQFVTDNNGLYATNYGSGGSWHGPILYMLLPSVVGKINQYWHVVFKYNIQSLTTAYRIQVDLRVGFTTWLRYFCVNGYSSFYRQYYSMVNNQSAPQCNLVDNAYSGQNINDTVSYYHYSNNTNKIYLNGTLIFNGPDPQQLNTYNNVLTLQISKYSNDGVPYHRIQEITVSTDPTYDPQP